MGTSGSKKGRVLVGLLFRRAGAGASGAAAAASCCCLCSALLLHALVLLLQLYCQLLLFLLLLSLVLLPSGCYCLFLLLSSLSSLLPAALLSLLCFFHSQTSMLKNTGLIDCIKARELHRPEAEEIFHVGCWCDLLLSCCSKAKRIACSRTCLLTCSAPQAENFGLELQMPIPR